MTTNNQNNYKHQQQSRFNMKIKCKAKSLSNQRINKIKRVENK